MALRRNSRWRTRLRLFLFGRFLDEAIYFVSESRKIDPIVGLIIGDPVGNALGHQMLGQQLAGFGVQTLSEDERNDYWSKLEAGLNTTPAESYNTGAKYVCYQKFSLARAAALVREEADLPNSLSGYAAGAGDKLEDAIQYCEQNIESSGLLTAASGIRLYYASYLWNTSGRAAIAKIKEVIAPVIQNANNERWDYSGFLTMLRISPQHANDMHVSLPDIAAYDPSFKAYLDNLGVTQESMANAVIEHFKFF